MSHEPLTWQQAHRDAVEQAAEATKERDAQYRWAVEIADLLGVPTGVTVGATTSEQYGELRARITAELRTINNLMDRAAEVLKRKRGNRP